MVVRTAIEERELQGGGFEATAGLRDDQLAADDEALVVGDDDRSDHALLGLLGQGGGAILGDLQLLTGHGLAEAGGGPLVIGARRGADDVELLTLDEGIGQVQVQAGLEPLGTLTVDGAVAEEIEAQARAEFAVALGTVLVVVGEEAAAAAVPREDVRAPERQALLQGDVGGVAVVIALRGDARPQGET